MTEAEKHGVTLDFCAGCGGMWIDKGELGKIVNHMREVETSLDREMGIEPRQGHYSSAPPPKIHGYGRDRHGDDQKYGDSHEYRDNHHDHDREHGTDPYYGRRKKTGFQKLFDIFD
jgi:Zn-finger nucleic acid-binding protein